MSDLISREDAIEAMKCINDSICAQQAVDAIFDLPTIDPVVRCKDCRWWGLTNFIIKPTGWCWRQEKPREPDWYCAGGERKGEE